MKKMKIVCQICDNRCSLEAEHEDGELVKISGNGCMRGMAYVQERLNEREELDDKK